MRGKRGDPPLGPLLALGLAATAVAVGSQQPTPPEVYLAGFTHDGNGVGPILNVTRNPGYDNQPVFLPNSKAILFSSNRQGSQTDIYRYDLKSGDVTRLTNTPESEYLPLPAPDGSSFSALRLEAGGVQRLWLYPARGGPATPIFEKPTRIASYAWIDKTHVALAVLDARGSGMTLQFGDTATGALETIASNIGRSLARRPGTDELSFLAKPATAAMASTVRTVNYKTHQVTDLVAAVKGSEDTAWNPDGDLLMAHGTSIFRWTKRMPTWTLLVDVSSALCTNVTRLAVSPDGKWLAFAAEPTGHARPG
jgi:dipeptidyl aminopeptidase/acylaminoacyl peptidase